MIDTFRSEYAFLSNFWPVSVVMDGERYASVESAYQASKSLVPAYRQLIRECGEDFRKVKRLGRRVPLRPDWSEELSLKIMHSLVRQKFAEHHALRMRLFATGEEELAEGNWWGDKFWGVYEGIGQNHLGKILMVVRKELR